MRYEVNVSVSILCYSHFHTHQNVFIAVLMLVPNIVCAQVHKFLFFGTSLCESLSHTHCVSAGADPGYLIHLSCATGWDEVTASLCDSVPKEERAVLYSDLPFP